MVVARPLRSSSPRILFSQASRPLCVSTRSCLWRSRSNRTIPRTRSSRCISTPCIMAKIHLASRRQPRFTLVKRRRISRWLRALCSLVCYQPQLLTRQLAVAQKRLSSVKRQCSAAWLTWVPLLMSKKTQHMRSSSRMHRRQIPSSRLRHTLPRWL